MAPFPGASLVPDACVGDYDADGHADVAVAVGGEEPTTPPVKLVVRFGDGTGALSAPVEAARTPAFVSTSPRCVALEATPGGPTEIALTHASSQVTIASSSGRAFAQQTLDAGPGRVVGLDAGDLDLDGDDDLVILRQVVTGDSVDLLVPFENTGTGFVERASNATTLTDPTRVQLVDLGEDGRPDAIVSSTSPGAVVVLPALRATLGFGPARAVAGVGGVGGRNAVTAGDVTGDGRADLLVGGDGVLRAFAGDGTGGVAAPQTIPGVPVAQFGSATVVLDADGDGALDAVAAAPPASPGTAGSAFRAVAFAGSLDPAARFLASATSTFGASTSAATTETTQRLVPGDLDEDGRPDLVAVTGGGAGAEPRIAVLLNTTAVPSVREVSASATSATSAVVRATVRGSNLPATAEVELVRSNGQVDVVAGSQQAVPADAPAATVELPVAGLPPATASALRVVVRTANGATRSRGVVVTTPAAPPGGGPTSGSPVPGTSAGGAGTPSAAPGVLQNRVRPRIRGRARVGQALACDVGAWSDGGRFIVRWLRGSQQVRGATTILRTVKAGDRGKTLRCRVTLRRDDGAALTVTSPPVRVPVRTSGRRR
ncbi:FG-GAP-like repeat-containing protein [Paraconexibacter algicola]|uniref:FG-GAP-like repeat-containing protein n=1 Tax=Paraconexibacter algicola TaxID=2133960 RepID=UPI001304891B|nr:FG-GAP-like repeat-containing protein [Paraconexibacter algicola]